MKTTLRGLAIALLIPLFLAVQVHAETASVTPETPANWWQKSSLDPTAEYSGWLKRLNLSLTYNHLTGNTEGYALGGSAGLTLRKGRTTGTLSYDINKKDITQGEEDTVKSEKWTTVLAGQYDFCRSGYGSAAYIWEQDSNNNIEMREITVAGIGSYLVSSERLNLNLFLGAGQTDEDYDHIVKRYTAIDNRTYNMLYLYQTLEWQITEWLTLSQGVRLIHSFSEMNEFSMEDETSAVSVTGQSRRDLLMVKVELQVPIRQYFSIFSSWNLNYDSHPWPGNDSTDTLTTVGLRFSH
ncbi:MAG: hypothetical protein C0614_04720 [Desulfuromonas sp.]|nr:MAG: hypothetical protein C0614_04720 [Desulfuromonas sp.]